jgi:hypothetical protein
MVARTFGESVREHVDGMATVPLKRRHHEDPAYRQQFDAAPAATSV